MSKTKSIFGLGMEVISLEQRMARATAKNLYERLRAFGASEKVARECQAMADAAEVRKADPKARKAAAEKSTDEANIDKANRLKAAMLADEIKLGL